MASDVFKICPMCSTVWKTRGDFLGDKTLEVNGYVTDFEKLEWSLFYFTHSKKNCGSTMAIEVKEFLNLYSGEQYTERRMGQEECPGYCLEKEQLNRCDAHCDCAFNREVLDVIKEKLER